MAAKRFGYFVGYGRREMAATMVLGLVVATASAALGALVSPWWFLLLLGAIALVAPVFAFFRNPRRSVPQSAGVLVAPADGTVTDVGECQEADFIHGPAVKVGIFLSPLDVHLNRSPCAGRVDLVRRHAGMFHSALYPVSSTKNEANVIGIVRQEPGGPPEARVVVKQIAGVIARRIVCEPAEGDFISRGEVIGMIKFGSRTEIYVPLVDGARFDLLVRPRARVRAGETVIGRWV